MGETERTQRAEQRSLPPLSLCSLQPMLLPAHLLRKAQGKAGSRRASPGVQLGRCTVCATASGPTASVSCRLHPSPHTRTRGFPPRLSSRGLAAGRRRMPGPWLSQVPPTRGSTRALRKPHRRPSLCPVRGQLRSEKEGGAHASVSWTPEPGPRTHRSLRSRATAPAIRADMCSGV